MLSNINTRAFPFVFISILTLFSIFVVPGYESFTSDQASFLPPLYRDLDPSLFPNADLEPFRIMHSERTLLNDMLAFFIRRGANIFWLLFLLSVALRTLFFAVLYSLIMYFTSNRLYTALILLFFITAFFIPGTGHVTIESTFTYRTIAVPLAFLYLTLYLYGWRFTSLIPLLCAFTIHPITSLPFFLFHYLHIGWETWSDRRVTIRNVLLSITPFASVLLFLWWRQSGATDLFFLRIDEEWKQLAYLRNAPAFFVFWDKNSYISLIGWLALGSIPILYIKKFLQNKKQQIAVSILFLIPFIMLALAALGEYVALHGIVKINLQRGLLLIAFFVPILFSVFTLWYAEQHRNDIVKNTFLFSVLAWFLFKDNFIFLREQMLLFIPPLALLFYGWPRTALGLFVALDAAVIYRSLFYSDISAIISFHLFLAAGWVIAWLYTKNYVSSTSLARYSVAAAVPFLLISSMLSVKSFTIYPAFSYNIPYQEACIWVQEHTAKDSIFIVEPFVLSFPPEDFRLACFRSIFTTFKDGGIVPYDENRENAFEWKRRYDLIYVIQEDFNILEQAKQQYRIDYIFSEKMLLLPERYPLVFSNNEYFIYDIRN